ncbi:MAG: hypothetical protein M1368_08810 [Thaumarchaeota archaeon]|nr:hypothetical protein [Nitrososphaerota archaeon]
MRRHGFVERDADPAQVYSGVKAMLQSEGFKVTSEETKTGYWDLHARKSGVERIALGKVRDVDVIVAGTKGKFEVQLHAGVWGRDLAVPAIEGIATLGLASAAELHSAHEFEERMWEQIVHKIDPSLKICQLDGLLFNSDQELQSHAKLHAQQQQAAQSSMMNSMLMMGMLGGVGMMGMGMMGGGLWI